MSLLVPDYSSSSEDEAPARVATPSAPAPALRSPPSSKPPETAEDPVEATKPAKTKATQKKKKQPKKPKTTLFLPPEIQKLLESGTLGDSDDDDDNADGESLLAKQKRAVAKRPRPAAPSTTGDKPAGTTLSFLPAPKHQIDEPKPKPTPAESDKPNEAANNGLDVAGPSAGPAEQTSVGGGAAPPQYYYDPQQQQYYDAQQYAQYYQQYYQQQQQQQHEFVGEEQHEPTTSKRARHRDRELERLLQQGQFNAVADKIVEVAAPAPDAWQAPPVEELKKGSVGELKVKASFWNSSAGAAVATVKPSRLQRQKHQLNQLAFDAKTREFELLDRKGAAIKTKRETHAKYGW